jgi:hypothetical protein
MYLHIILFFASLFISLSIFYYLWHHGRLTRADILSLAAVMISLLAGAYTFLSRNLPIEIEVFSTYTTLSSLPEENKKLIFQDCFYFDVKNEKYLELKNIKQQLPLNEIGLRKLEFDSILQHLTNKNIRYSPSTEALKRCFGKSPFAIPIIQSLSFVNKTPNPVTIDEIYLTVKNGDSKLIYKPFFYINDRLLFSNKFKKITEILDSPFHPFLLNGNTNKELHLFFTKWNSERTDELNIGENKITLVYHTSGNHTYSEEITPIVITDEILLSLFNGNKITFSKNSPLFEKLISN